MPAAKRPAGQHGGKRPGSGRKKGTPNKITATVREAVEQAFNELGGKDWLIHLAVTEPKAFAALVGKVMPAKIEAEVSVTIKELEERLAKGRQRVAAGATAGAAINRKAKK